MTQASGRCLNRDRIAGSAAACLRHRGGHVPVADLQPDRHSHLGEAVPAQCAA
jgi:hypothetical protein